MKIIKIIGIVILFFTTIIVGSGLIFYILGGTFISGIKLGVSISCALIIICICVALINSID